MDLLINLAAIAVFALIVACFVAGILHLIVVRASEPRLRHTTLGTTLGATLRPASRHARMAASIRSWLVVIGIIIGLSMVGLIQTAYGAPQGAATHDGVVVAVTECARPQLGLGIVRHCDTIVTLAESERSRLDIAPRIAASRAVEVGETVALYRAQSSITLLDPIRPSSGEWRLVADERRPDLTGLQSAVILSGMAIWMT